MGDRRRTSLAVNGCAETARTATVDVSVVICTRNRAHHLEECLRSIAAVAGLDDPGRCEVLVVDNASHDDTPAVIARWTEAMPQLRSVVEPRTGLSHARNAALEHARGGVIAFLDDDVLVDPDWLAGLWTAYVADPDLVGLAGRVELAWPTGRPSWLPASREVWFASLDLGPRARRLADDELPVGANMSVRATAARAAGGFDPTLGYNGRSLLGNEELDFFRRVRGAHGPLGYAPDASVRHIVDGRRLKRRYLWRRIYAQGRSDVRVELASSTHERRDVLSLARRAAARAVVRNLRHDVGRVVRPGRRERELVDLLAGRAKQAGRAHEALAALVAAGRAR